MHVILDILGEDEDKDSTEKKTPEQLDLPLYETTTLQLVPTESQEAANSDSCSFPHLFKSI